MRHPSPLLAFDETLYWYLGHIGVKQYNPNKPAKYGLLYRNLCDSSIPYTCYILPYAGKPENIDGAGAKYSSPEPTSIPNISSTSCLYTAIFKGSIYPWIATSHQFFGNIGFREKHHHCRNHEARPKGHP